MIIECPKCKSTFSLDSEQDLFKISRFKCSVCNHIWENTKEKEIKHLPEKESRINKSFKSLLSLNLVIIIFSIISLFIFKDSLIYVDEYWMSFYNFFINLIPI